MAACSTTWTLAAPPILRLEVRPHPWLTLPCPLRARMLTSGSAAPADGGNIEGTQTASIDQAYNTTAACLSPPAAGPPLCPTFQVRLRHCSCRLLCVYDSADLQRLAIAERPVLPNITAHPLRLPGGFLRPWHPELPVAHRGHLGVAQVGCMCALFVARVKLCLLKAIMR